VVGDLEEQYLSRTVLLRQLAQTLHEGLSQTLEHTPHVDRITFRAKALESFRAKAGRPEYDHPLQEIEDQVAGRVLVFFTSDIDVVRAAAATRWSPVEDHYHRPAADAEFGYETHHQIFLIPEHVKPARWSDLPDMPVTFELQIRTLFMHAYAEPQHEFGYKHVSDLSSNVRRQLAWVASSAWGADHAYEAIREAGPGPEDY
jgi:putative GTP pyrophosphokinase